MKNDDIDTVSAFLKATSKSNIEQVRRLLDEGVDVNSQGSSGRSALIYAIDNVDIEIIQLLISHGINLNLKNKAGWTALHWAANRGLLNIVQLLVNNGAEIDAEDEDGNTPLWRAVMNYTDRDENRSSKIIEYLLSKGADGFKTNKHGVSPSKLTEYPVKAELSKFFI